MAPRVKNLIYVLIFVGAASAAAYTVLDKTFIFRQEEEVKSSENLTGRYDTIKIDEQYFAELEKQCAQGDECCLSSVKAMKQGNYKKAENNTCSAGFEKNMMRCQTSYKWCQPLPQGNKTGWETYSDAKYGFTIQYPKNEFKLYTDYNQIEPLSFIPVCDKNMVGCLFYSRDNQKDTNLEGAGVSVNILKNLTTQYQCETMEGARGVMVKINDETFSRFGNSGAATGHFEEFQANRIFKNNTCYEVRLRMTSANIDNYPPESGVKEFNNKEVWNKLEQVLSTFKFVDPSSTAREKQITVTGTTVCLPHKNVQPGQPQTLECAIGLKEEGTGKYYGLKDNPNPIYDVNVKVQVNGILQDDSQSNYDTVGAIKVSQITQVSK